MRWTGYAVALGIAGLAATPVTADATAATLNSCVTGGCGSFIASLTMAITDNLSGFGAQPLPEPVSIALFGLAALVFAYKLRRT